MLVKKTIVQIFPDKEWEKGAELDVISVCPDEKNSKLRMYYLARFRGNPLKNVVCMAESKDGYLWVKPALAGGKNIIMKGSGNTLSWGQFMPTSIFVDKREVFSAYRWKMVYWDRPSRSLYPGICLAVSPDGIKWKPFSQYPVITNMNDAMTLIDNRIESETLKASNAYFIYQQTWKFNPFLPVARENIKRMHRRISVWYSGSSFSEQWIGPVTVLEPDEKDPFDLQFYLLTPFHVPKGFGGLLMCHHTTDQTMDIQLVSSADGLVWKRENNRKPLIPLGKRGQFDCGMVFTTASPLLWNGKVLLFYEGRSSVHDGKPRYAGNSSIIRNIGLAEFKENVFSCFQK